MQIHNVKKLTQLWYWVSVSDTVHPVSGIHNNHYTLHFKAITTTLLTLTILYKPVGVMTKLQAGRPENWGSIPGGTDGTWGPLILLHSAYEVRAVHPHLTLKFKIAAITSLP